MIISGDAKKSCNTIQHLFITKTFFQKIGIKRTYFDIIKNICDKSICTVHEVLMASILRWFATLSSLGISSNDCVDHNKLWKAVKEMGNPDCLTCLLKYLYVGQVATVTILYGITDWFKMTKGVGQGYLLSSCLFNLYSEHIMRNAELDELQAGIKIGGRNNQQPQICR